MQLSWLAFRAEMKYYENKQEEDLAMMDTIEENLQQLENGSHYEDG